MLNLDYWYVYLLRDDDVVGDHRLADRTGICAICDQWEKFDEGTPGIAG